MALSFLTIFKEQRQYQCTKAIRKCQALFSTAQLFLNARRNSTIKETAQQQQQQNNRAHQHRREKKRRHGGKSERLGRVLSPPHPVLFLHFGCFCLVFMLFRVRFSAVEYIALTCIDLHLKLA